ncbi:MAG: N-acetylmuramoyl-L-alanine amidase [Capsulimonadaceae bacterium]|nr:N-acetylmuramoyl-L-alanine amidase [Capsulimonadaceae bacterium]
MNIIGKRFSPDEFWGYAAQTIGEASWKGSFVVLHNTGSPTLAQRPSGLTSEHITNLRLYYEDLGWHAGPHLFIDQNGIWVFSPLTAPGVHSPSWNHVSYGVEQLGDFDREAYTSGPGALVRANAISALAALHHAACIDSATLKLHRMDPKTTHRDCPGAHCADEFEQIMRDVHAAVVAREQV